MNCLVKLYLTLTRRVLQDFLMCSHPPKKIQSYRGKSSHSSKKDAAVNNNFGVIVHTLHTSCTSETLTLLPAPRWDISSELPLLPLLHLAVFLGAHPSTVLKSLLHFSCLFFFTFQSLAVPAVIFFLFFNLSISCSLSRRRVLLSMHFSAAALPFTFLLLLHVLPYKWPFLSLCCCFTVA